MRITLTTNAPEVSAFCVETAAKVRLFGAAASATLGATVNAVVTPMLIEETPQGQTGDLKKSQGRAMMTVGPAGAALLWESDSPYADYVLHGTGIHHTPDPHSAWDVYGLQVFQVQGTTVFTRHTHHEGQKPDDWPARALLRAEPLITAALDALDDQLSAVFG